MAVKVKEKIEKLDMLKKIINPKSVFYEEKEM